MVTAFHCDLLYQVSMRGDDQKQTAMFSYLTLAQRIPMDHPAHNLVRMRGLIPIEAMAQ
jgi:hypothetical protein